MALPDTSPQNSGFAYLGIVAHLHNRRRARQRYPDRNDPPPELQLPAAGRRRPLVDHPHRQPLGGSRGHSRRHLPSADPLRILFWERLSPLPAASLQRFRQGDLLNRLVADIDA